MSTTRMPVVAGLIALVLTVAAFQQAPLTLTGVVRDAATGRPLPGAAVRVTEAGSVDARVAIADRDGRYRFSDLPPGRYEVSVRLDGYLDGRFGQSRVGAPGRLVDLRSTHAAADVGLWQGAVITGVVYGSDGRPRSGLEVATLKRDMEFGQPRLAPAGRPVRTNDRGEYRMFGLEPGRYFVLATPPIGGAAAFGTQADSYTYAPGVTDAREATAIEATGGTDTVVNLTLQRRPVYTVSGAIDARLLPETGPSFVEFRLLSTRAVRIVSAQPDGTFAVKGLLPGRYKVTIGAPGARAADSGPLSSTIVEVVNSDVSGLVLGPLTRSRVLGRVRMTSGRGLTADEIEGVRISSVPAERDTQPALPSAATIALDSTFALDVWPGQFVLRLVTRRAGWVITKVTQHGRDVTTGLEATGPELSGIDVHVTDAAPRLRGTVSRDAATTGHCAAVAFAADQKLWRTGAGIAQALVGADGAFSMNSLAPGDYHVAAAVTADTLEDPALLQVLRAGSTRVRLSEGITSEVTLRCSTIGGSDAPGQTQ